MLPMKKSEMNLIENIAQNDTDFSSLWETMFTIMDSEQNLETSCRHVTNDRVNAIRKLYQRYSTPEGKESMQYMVPGLQQLLYKYTQQNSYYWTTAKPTPPSEQVQLQMECELGICDCYWYDVYPVPQITAYINPFACAALVIDEHKFSTHEIDYRIRLEYDTQITSNSWYIDPRGL